MDYLQVSNPEDWVNQYGNSLFRFALGRVRDSGIAEDLVQETFLAALRARERFLGTSTERTWLIGILKHKVMDHFRKISREAVVDEVEWLETVGEDESVFDQHGHWKSNGTAPKEWPSDPSSLVEQKEFWQVLNQALSELPPRMAMAFLLREVDGFSTEEICETLHITQANLWVILHRARKHLRNRLEGRLMTCSRQNLQPIVA